MTHAMQDMAVQAAAGESWLVAQFVSVPAGDPADFQNKLLGFWVSKAHHFERLEQLRAK